jgi:hypothetical protein
MNVSRPGPLPKTNANVSEAPVTAKRTGSRQLARKILIASTPISVAGKFTSTEGRPDSNVASASESSFRAMPMHSSGVIFSFAFD